MGLFAKRKEERLIIIIGCSQLGANIANTISDSGGSVLIIDRNEEAFRKLANSFGGLTVIGDGTEISVLLEADIRKAYAVIAVTNNDNTNILVAQMAKEMFHIPNVIARLYDSERECVYNEFGIDTICPAELSAKEIDKILSMGNAAED